MKLNNNDKKTHETRKILVSAKPIVFKKKNIFCKVWLSIFGIVKKSFAINEFIGRINLHRVEKLRKRLWHLLFGQAVSNNQNK